MSFPFLPALRAARCGDPGAEIPFACLFDAAGQYLTGTGGPGTLVAWVRRARLGAASNIVTGLAFAAADTLAGSTAVYRDPAAWMVVQANANGVWVNHALVAPGIATIGTVLGSAFGGYLADVRYYAGVDLAPGSDSYINRFGVPVPRRYAGPRSAADWRREFADPLDLGADTSGNGNHAVATGLTVANQVTDTPTHTYCTLAANATFGGATISDGGLRFAYSSAGWPRAAGTIAIDVATDAVSWQLTPTNTGTPQWYFGLIGERASSPANVYTDVLAVGFSGDANYDNHNFVALPAWIPTGARIEFAVIRGAVYLWINGSPAPADGSPIITGMTGRYRPMVSYSSSGTNPAVWQVDFGQRGYQPRPGTRLLCTRDMTCPPIKRPERYFGIRLRSGGDGVADLPWSPVDIPTAVLSRRRDAAAPWRLNLSIRPGRAIATNDAAGDFAEADGLTFTRSGWTVGAAAAYQGSRVDYVWRASAAAGFDLLTVDHVTGAPTTVAHKLGRIVDYAWVLNLSTGAIKRMYHRRGLAAGQYIAINANVAAVTEAGWFASDALSLTLGSGLPSGTYAVLAWAEVPQFSSFGRHIGNASADGAFAAMDFAPALAITKNTAVTSANYPTVQDTARSPHNPIDNRLWLSDAANAETSDGNGLCDFVSNGLKVRTTHNGLNGSGQTIIHAAWAGTPQKFGRAR
ncbi:hypothetical protein KL86APRO_20409 [uncultured Alphaproteobacteria bacterium]|uniref:DUF7483 domain-containing protein n=1 Tax=uncultured Alphaproteobacteria bacterium TaxID=91750 RepID=A0A212KK55_9PROT|nr:hypothetical protein KL86APRO_20409 [uncultured Alphaproteobacteria bacterium]